MWLVLLLLFLSVPAQSLNSLDWSRVRSQNTRRASSSYIGSESQVPCLLLTVVAIEDQQRDAVNLLSDWVKEKGKVIRAVTGSPAAVRWTRLTIHHRIFALDVVVRISIIIRKSLDDQLTASTDCSHQRWPQQQQKKRKKKKKKKELDRE